MEDDILTKELWGIKGFYWSLPVNNNYTAEMSAINKAIHSVPPTVHVTIHTDSLNFIQAITRHRTYSLKSNLHKCNARPYLIATLRAITQREALGGTTTLLHVRAHTGLRDKPSVGNVEADHLAKGQALQPDAPTDSSLDHLHNELQYILNTIVTTIHPSGRVTTTLKPIHDSVPRTIRAAHSVKLRQLWQDRPRRGELAHLHPRGVLGVIDKIWKHPTSASLLFLLETLTQFTRKSYASPTPKAAIV
jgi:ribonuclease HI